MNGNTASASVVIGNSTPVVSNVSITPNPAYTTDVLSCSYSFADGDNDPDQSTIVWSVNSGPAGVGQSLSGVFTGGDTVSCAVTPFDGVVAGTPVSASIVISNSAPSIASVTISPDPATVTDPLTCAYSGFTDLDGDADASTYSWTVNGSSAGSASTLSTGFAAGDTVVCTVTPFDGTVAGAPLSDTIVISNSAPTVSAVSISPSAPLVSDDLTCSYSFADADNDSDSSSITWLLGNATVGTGPTLPANTAAFGDTVTCEVTANDGAMNGNTASASVVIGSTAPTISSVSISPNPAYETDTLSCSYSGFQDLDCPNGSCDQSTYQWLVDGAPVGTGSTLLGGFSVGQTVTCQVTPNDGTVTGIPVSDSLTIQNTTPTVTAVIITPSTPIYSDNLSCSYAFYDANNDSDSSQMTWWVNGVQVGNGASLPSGSATKGETVTCEVTANDGIEDGNTASASVVIGNTAPSVSNVIISPNPAYADDVLGCSYSFADVDNDPNQSSIQWLINGTVVGQSASLATGIAVGGDNVTCEVQSFDGADYGTTASTSIIITNSLPTAPLVQISPLAPYDNVDMYCAVSVPSTDMDNETVRYEFTWRRNGVLTAYTATNGTMATVVSVPLTATVAGEEWTCTVTPYDLTSAGPSSSKVVTILDSCAPSATGDWSGEYSLCIADAMITGQAAGDTFGSHVAAGGDMNGDGFDEAIITSWKNSTGGTEAGSTYLYFGDTLSAGGEYSANNADAQFFGRSEYTRSGSSSTSAGDVDGNGLADLLINSRKSPAGIAGAGSVHLFRDSTVAGGGTFELTPYVADSRFLGNYNQLYGHSVSSAGDVDGDGKDDILFSSQLQTSRKGRTLLFLSDSLLFGPYSSYEVHDADNSFSGESNDDRSGCAVSNAGDMDGDGLGDIMISACATDAWRGTTYVFLGKTIMSTSGDFSLASADAILTGENGSDIAGFSISAAGDVDGDGQDDILIGAPGIWPISSGYPGKAYLVLGKTLFPSPNTAPVTMSLASADAIFTGEGNGEYAGYSVSGAGDVDGDGKDDLLLGALGAHVNQAGKSYLWLASSIGTGGNFDIGAADAIFIGESTGDESGASVSFAGDIDRDGLDDLLIGARGNDEAGTNAGKAYVLLSPYNAPPTAPQAVISPMPNSASDDLDCSIDQPAIDPDGDPVTYTFQWYGVGMGAGGMLTPATNQPATHVHTLPASYQALTTDWACTVFAEDGIALSAGEAHTAYSQGAP